ncbi:MAG: T9SS type A sorting domain-containing protein [candidate division KSB1 bacterium]|nr:T9SS type A sorting domain-containing protein [candidate division KSB1 bacterium]
MRIRLWLTLSATVFLASGVGAQRLRSTDLIYKGAFRLPAPSGGSNWSYSGLAMTYYPDGDPSGPADGYPGSLFVLGHDHHQQVAEISIPIPVVSPTKRLADLNTATTLQAFRDIKGSMFGDLELPCAGLEYLPAQGAQTTGKLHFCWGQHFQFERAPTHGWCELNLSSPQPAGPWFFGEYSNYVSNDYLFEIPAEWAARHAPGMRLATGRFREGHWSGMGPALFAYAPWQNGNPPMPNSTLTAITPLLLYGENVPGTPEIVTYEDRAMRGFSPPDCWSGGAWLTAGSASAVIFVGTKAIGRSWYGYSDGTVYPDDPPYPPIPPFPHDERGWWSESIRARILFFDPNELAAVAAGSMNTWEPQPYDSLDIDQYLFDPGFDYPRYKKHSLGAAAFDRARSLLYIVERRADEDEKSLIHVFRVTAGTGVGDASMQEMDFKLLHSYPNPTTSGISLTFTAGCNCSVRIEVHNLAGQLVTVLLDDVVSAGPHTLVWDGRDARGRNLPSGVYLCQVGVGATRHASKIVLVRQ